MLGVEWTTCPNPDCGRIAEVVDRWEQDSTNGPVACMATVCVSGHRYFGVADDAAVA